MTVFNRLAVIEIEYERHLFLFVVLGADVFFLVRFIFFFNDTATTEIYTLSLHDALPIFPRYYSLGSLAVRRDGSILVTAARSEEHTSELQSRRDLVCRLLLEKKKKT